MSITLSGWVFPTAITIVFWIWAICWPLPANRGDYDFTRQYTAMARGVGAIIGTLAVWLIYFIVLAVSK